MDIFTRTLDSQGRTLSLLAQRQKVLAGNIANADTPGFKARDFDFAAALDQARGQTGAPAGMAATAPGHLRVALPAQVQLPAGQLQWRRAEQPSMDGNTVDMDRERADFADNAMRYEATLRFINHDVRTMLSAITGQ